MTGALALVGAAGLGIPVGWAAGNPRSVRPIAFTLSLSLVLAPAVVLLLTSAAAAIVTLSGVLAGCVLRLLLDVVLAQGTNKQGRR